MVYSIYPGVDENFNFPPEIKTMYKGQILSTQNLDDYIDGGMWSYYSNNPTAPFGTSGTLIVSPILNNNTTVITQFAIEYGHGDSLMKRFRGSGGWSAWIKVNEKFKKDPFPEGVDIREYAYGIGAGQYSSHYVATTQTLTGLPQELIDEPAAFTMVSETLVTGTVLTLTSYSVFKVERWVCTSAPSTGDGWTKWYKVKWDTGDSQEATITGSTSAGSKTLPYILTAGAGGGEEKAPLSAKAMYNVGLSPDIPVLRYRLAFRDGNPRWGTNTAQKIILNNLKIGGVLKQTSFTSTMDGSISFTPWMTGTLGNVEFDYVAEQAPRYIVGGGTINGVRRVTMPFEMWLEIEVPKSVPAIGLIGDSNSVGVNSTIPIHDAWMSIYCRDNGYFPVLYGSSGEGMKETQDPKHYKWNRWNHLDKPDMVVHANGANDIPSTEGGITTQELIDRLKGELAMADQKVAKIHYVCVIKSKPSGANNTQRVEYNNYVKKREGLNREWQDIASPVTANDSGGLLPEYISSDNLHMNTAGQTAIARSGLKQMSYRTDPLVRNTSAGQTVTVWDPSTNKDVLLAGNTGVRKLTPPAPYLSGTIGLVRRGNVVELNLQAIKFVEGTAGSVTFANLIPVGFRPSGIVAAKSVKFWSNETEESLRVTNAGSLMYQLVVAATNSSAQLIWTTEDPWPTTLPGTA